MMGFKCGLVGLPNVGKSTLFTALSSLPVERAKFPFSTVEPNKGIVPVHDERLYKVAKLVASQKVTPATLTIIDIAGLIKGASKGEGLGNRFLAHIREMDLLLHVVRGFNSADIPHLPGNTDPCRDIEIVEMELMLADLAYLERRQEKVLTGVKSGFKEAQEEKELLEKVFDHLNSGRMARSLPLSAKEQALVASWHLLTAKPVIYIVNIGEDELAQKKEPQSLSAVRLWAAETGSPVISICASLEVELAGLANDEKKLFRQEYGLEETGLNMLLKSGYSYLQLVTFFTVKGKEAKAWAVQNGTTARKAAGKIHSDMERGFIAAEVIQWNELIRAGSLAAAKEKGILRLEGKDYIVGDGDVILFRFKV